METLNEVERRVLGVLLEKSLAQPAYYPMTLTAITAACNQKNNRDPLLELDEELVWNTVEALRTRGLVVRLLPAGSGRSERYRHDCAEQLRWEKPQRAIMAELLLRGPQTLNELRTRAGRMYAFENNEAAAAVLDTLIQRDPPHVRLLPRAPGQREPRYMHLLYPEREREAVAAGRAAGRAAGSPAAGIGLSDASTPDASALGASAPGASALGATYPGTNVVMNAASRAGDPDRSAPVIGVPGSGASDGGSGLRAAGGDAARASTAGGDGARASTAGGDAARTHASVAPPQPEWQAEAARLRSMLSDLANTLREVRAELAELRGAMDEQRGAADEQRAELAELRGRMQRLDGC